MIGAILKLSYNRIGDNTVIGGICATCFFIHPKIALTANHALSQNNFKPNEGCFYCQYWIILQDNTVVPVIKNQLYDFPEIDLTIINFDYPVTPTYLNVANNYSIIGEQIFGRGYFAEEMPHVSNFGWRSEGIFIQNAYASKYLVEREGIIRRICIANIKENDVNIKDKIIIDTSFASGFIGMSGGPIIKKTTQEVLGLMCIGLPPDVTIKDQIMAISIEEIMKVLWGRGLL